LRRVVSVALEGAVDGPDGGAGRQRIRSVATRGQFETRALRNCLRESGARSGAFSSTETARSVA
jgi:hypothetical protein